MSIRATLEGALSTTANRLSPGSGEQAVRHAKHEIEMIASSSDDAIRVYATGEVRIAAPVVFESKRPDGDPVVFDKPRDGVVVVFSGALVFVRAIAFGARESKGIAVGDLSVEKVECVVGGRDVPGLRITGRGGKPAFAVAIGDGRAPSSASEQAAVRDEIYELLTS